MSRRTLSPAEQARHYAKLATRWSRIAITFATISLIAAVLVLVLS